MEKQANTESQQVHQGDTITTVQGIESHKNTNAFIKGRFQKFTPWTQGKGANHMFWDWEIVIEGGANYPVISKSNFIELGNYENKDVLIYGNVFFGIIIGDDDVGHQSASGFRIDAESIHALENTVPGYGLDTCREWSDIESHWNKDAYVEGKIIVYEPPHDNSKLGDEKIWDWEIVIADNHKIPIISTNPSLKIARYVGKSILVKAFIKYGIIFGYENTANMVGTRIDAVEMVESDLAKIRFGLGEFNSEGLRERPKGEFSSINYEFCIPASDETAREVQSIDPTLGIYKTSKGRSGCSDKEWLCIGSSRGPNFREKMLRLASLSYIREINETFWE